MVCMQVGLSSLTAGDRRPSSGAYVARPVNRVTPITNDERSRAWLARKRDRFAADIRPRFDLPSAKTGPCE